MPTPLESLPPLIQRQVAAKKAVIANASPEEVEFAAAFQREQRNKMSARRAAATERTRAIVTMFLAGASTKETAATCGMTESGLRMAYMRLGLPYRFTPFRVVTIAASMVDDAVLVDLANDFDMVPDVALQKVMELQARHAFEENGVVARRLLRSKVRR